MRGLFVVSLMALGGGTFAQVSAKGGAYLLRVKLEKGRSYAFDLVLTASRPGSEPKITKQRSRIEIKEISHGVARADYSFNSDPQVKGDDGSSKPRPIKLNPLFEDSNHPTQSPINWLVASYPDRPIRVGQSWTKGLKELPIGLEGATGKQRFTFKGFGFLNRRRVAVVALNLDVRLSSKEGFRGVIKGEGTTYLNPSDGFVEQSECKLTANFYGNNSHERTTAQWLARATRIDPSAMGKR